MKRIDVKMDGKENGFALCDSKSEKLYDEKLFGSIELLKTYYYQEEDIFVSSNKDYSIQLVSKQYGFYVSINDTQLIDGRYEYYATADYLVVFEPTIIERILEIGYFVFENGDSKFVDKEYGLKRTDQLYAMIKEALTHILLENEKNYTISEFFKDDNNHLTALVKGSTCKIKICFSTQLMNLNLERKEKNIRCIPFLKNMDKFVTFFIYITKDNKENEYYNSEISANRIRDKMIDYINQKYPETELKYTNVNFGGVIYLNGDE